MDTTLTPPPATAPAAATLRSQAVEQIMRTCNDELAVLPFLDVQPGTRSAASALGRLLTEHPMRLVSGCPLMSVVAGVDPDPRWRDSYPGSEHSLWAELTFLRSLYGPADVPDPYTELELLRQSCTDEVTASW